MYQEVYPLLLALHAFSMYEPLLKAADPFYWYIYYSLLPLSRMRKLEPHHDPTIHSNGDSRICHIAVLISSLSCTPRHCPL